MNLIISGELTAPKSEVGAFRTLTLYATVFRGLDCLVECQENEIDVYYKWLKRNWSYDFIKAMVKIDEERGILLRYSKLVNCITFNNLNEYILILKGYK